MIAQPISEQFVVLEKKLPELRNPENIDDDKQGRWRWWKQRWKQIPLWCRMLILQIGCSSILLIPLLWAHHHRLIPWNQYPWAVYIPWSNMEWSLEVSRWVIFFLIVINGAIFTRYSSLFVPQAVAALAKRTRKILSHSLVARLETICMLWRYLSYNLFSGLLWLLSLEFYPYPDELVNAAHHNGSYEWSLLPIQFYVERTLLLLFVSSIFLSMEKLLLHWISKEFNSSLYRERIQKSLYALWTVAVLKKVAILFNYSPLANIPPDNFEKLWRPKNCPYESADLMSIFILEQFVKLGKKSGERKETMARRLFRFLVPPNPLNHHHHQRQLVLNDIKPFFTRTEVEKAFAVIDIVGAGNVSEGEFVKVIDEIYRERTNLINVLLTNSDVIWRLDRFMITFVLILMIFASFPIFGLSPTEALVPLGVSIAPTIVAATLIFGETIKSIFASVIFLFATHPYDVGDRVYMDQGSFFVREIGLLYTMFERWDGFIVYIPNSVLATKAICNVRRTGAQSQRIEISLPFGIKTMILTELEHRLINFVQIETKDFAAVRSFAYEMRDVNSIVMILTLKHRMNWQDGPKRVLRNNKFLEFLAKTMNELGIQYYTTVRCLEMLPPNELIG